MSVLCIYGCGGMGREIAELAQRIEKWEKILFVDDNKQSTLIDGIEVYTLDELRAKISSDNLEFIVTTGEPSSRQHLYNKLAIEQLSITQVIAPEFILSKTSSISQGTIIHTGAIVTCNVHIGKGCLINKHVVIGHDVTIGDYCNLSPNVTVGGNVTIGNNCYIGSGAVIRNGITIGDNAIIGMGSVVLKSVEPGSVMVGNPAKFLRKNIDNRVFRRDRS
jgi:sugar O-acyltransferase (sialic acid O-acetyltransferase NeuD family)